MLVVKRWTSSSPHCTVVVAVTWGRCQWVLSWLTSLNILYCHANILYCHALYCIVLNITKPMVCHVLYCIVLTSPNMAQSHQDSLSWLCLHLLLINCVSVLAWCVYLYNVHGGSCCEFDQAWEDPPNPLLQTIPLQVASALGSVTVTLYWDNL